MTRVTHLVPNTDVPPQLGHDAIPLLTAVIDGDTLLHSTIQSGELEACQALIDMHVIDLEAKNSNGLTVLQVSN